MTSKRGKRPAPAEKEGDDDDEGDDGDDVLAISKWASMRKRKLPKVKWSLTDNVAFDPLVYTIARYVSLPMANDQQMKISDLRKQFILNYMNSCRAKASAGSTATIITIYTPLLEKPENLKDTCKLLNDDLKLFFMHDDEKQTMSPCMFPSIFECRQMFTPEFFQAADWRDRVKHDIRLFPAADKKVLFDRVLDPRAEWCIDKTKPFDNRALEQLVRLPIVKTTGLVKDSINRAYGSSLAQDRGRELLLNSAVKMFRDVASRIDQLVDSGIDGSIALDGYEEERENPDSCDTIRILARFSAEIKAALGINMPI